MLTALPVEVVLIVLSFIPIRQLQRLRRVSKEWEVFFAKNESSIYHAACILHDFTPSHASLTQCKAVHTPWLADVQTWKDFCKKFYAMESRWEANGRVRYAPVTSTGGTVHRFKIDTEQRTVITTHFDGGLRVSGIEEDVILWTLRPLSVHPWAHCEYDGGFLVFTRIGEAMEVWRRKRDALVNQRPSSLKPDVYQLIAEQLSFQSSTSLSQNDRGAFVPWTLIVPPNPVHALRLVASTLLVASPSAQEAYLYDVTTGNLMQTISLGNPQDEPVDIGYVELGARHVFVCTESDVLVLPRDTTHPQAALKFPSQVENLDAFYAENTYTLNRLATEDTLTDSMIGVPPTLRECFLEMRVSGFSTVQPRTRNFTAVHVSSCGSHFVATDKRGCLYLVRNFEQAIRGTVPLSRCVTILDVLRPITYLALDEDKRACIHVQDRGVFIVSFVSDSAASINTLDMRPHRPYPRLLHATEVGICDHSPCIQLTRTELWTKKDLDMLFGVGMNKLCYLDFTVDR